MRMAIEIRGSNEVKRALTKLGADLLNLAPEMDEIGRMLEEYYAGQGFGSRGQVFGMRWDRLSPKYAVAKAKKFPGRPTLERTGAMRKGFYHVFNGSSVVIKNKSPYFKYHQSWEEPRKKIPHRLMMAINSQNNEAIRQTIEAGVRRKIDGAMR
jgi:hypothetical protein